MCYSPWGRKASDRTKCLTLPCARYWGKTVLTDMISDLKSCRGREVSPGGKESPCQCRRRWLYPRKWQKAPGFLPGKFHGERNLVGFRSMESQKVWLFQQLDGENTCALTRLPWAANAYAEPQRWLGRKRQVMGSEAPAWGEPTY